jgi:hypothetical protein
VFGGKKGDKIGSVIYQKMRKNRGIPNLMSVFPYLQILEHNSRKTISKIHFTGILECPKLENIDDALGYHPEA